jgi:condensin complex subunit 2
MSKLDSAYDIDPLFHKMSKSFDEGGAKGLLLGNLGVSQRGCRIVFDSKEDEDDEEDDDGVGAKDNVDVVDPGCATAWDEREIDVSRLAAKLVSTLASIGHRTPASVPFVPQLESLRRDYAALEEEGYAVDERDAAAAAGGRKRLRLYDAP